MPFPRTSGIDFDTFYNIIDGRNRGGEEVQQGIDPSTGKLSWPVPVANELDLNDAVEAGQRAFPAWRDTPMQKRRETLLRFCDYLGHFTDDLVALLCKETGKPRELAADEVGKIVDFIRCYVSLEIPEHQVEDNEKIIYTKHTPLGVCAGIVPWNFPLILAIGKVVPALLTGNAVIIKPSPFTPYTGLKIVEMMQPLFAPGLVQALVGDDKLGADMCTHPGIAKISFTGSTATGKKIMAACAGSLKRVTLELGGNDACIILPDVDIGEVAPKVVMGAFLNSGQVCIATKRIYIHESIYKSFRDEMVKYANTIKVGHPDDGGNLLGPIQNAMQYQKVRDLFADCGAKGFKFVVGKPDIVPDKGFFVPPAIIDNPPDDSCIVVEEPFGPIAPIQPWSDIDEVVARANDTKSGLGACVWGKDVEKAATIARRLDVGSVFINSCAKISPQAVFGGHKESGIGVEGGVVGLLAYTNALVVHPYK